MLLLLLPKWMHWGLGADGWVCWVAGPGADGWGCWGGERQAGGRSCAGPEGCGAAMQLVRCSADPGAAGLGSGQAGLRGLGGAVDLRVVRNRPRQQPWGGRQWTRAGFPASGFSLPRLSGF